MLPTKRSLRDPLMCIAFVLVGRSDLSAGVLRSADGIRGAGRPDGPEVRIAVVSPAKVAETDRDRARHGATAILSSAAVRVAWRDSAWPSGGPPPIAAGGVTATVLILDDQPGAESNACGRAARAPGGRAGTVFANLTCIARVLQSAQRSPAGRAHPAVARLTVGDLLGAVIAHEVGHLLGVGHTRAGLMRASLGIEEIAALHTGHLRFSRADAAAMRAWLLRAPSGSLAGLAHSHDPADCGRR